MYSVWSGFPLDFLWISSYPLHLFSAPDCAPACPAHASFWDQQAAATKIWLTYSNWPTWNSLKRLASLRQVWWLRDIVIKRLHKTRLRVGGWVGVLLRFGFCSSWMRCNHITHTQTQTYTNTQCCNHIKSCLPRQVSTRQLTGNSNCIWTDMFGSGTGNTVK